ncbi:nuclear transport factor 2 family protein [Spirosoma foliorum]|uniref:Nuclear transport factor 2 family protein n=1 Tax=Spirosoma foliorum TaxID=2710596 RepID=A0A7G5H1E1_9BACT|nr:nuclear transport factor 2 family protein [Spirosoma foliorum]QMW04933.1 nuclear transport factor 2 family protein [Spirosoma foliorum]
MLTINDMETKQTVQHYFDAIIAGKFEEAQQWKAPDEKHWISGEGSWPFGGWQTADRMARIHETIRSRFPKGLQITINSILTEGEHAAVHLRNYTERIDGRIYDNQIVFLMRVKNGLIVEEKEFLDTILVNELVCGKLDE